VIVAGWQEDVRLYMAAADIILITSRYEGCPYTIAEAMSMAKPVIATEATGTIDLIKNGETGYLFKLGDPLAGVRIVNQVLQKMDIAELVGEQGRELICNRFTLKHMQGRLLNAYNQACDQPKFI
jgi:glycosyltransferase involved in cell wall biosynthesis